MLFFTGTQMTNVRRLVACLSIAAFAMSVGAIAQDKKDKKDDKAKIMDIDEVMDKAHDKKTGYVAKLKTAVKGEKWEDAEKLAMSLTTAASDLGMNKPPRGEAKSWETLTKKYSANVKVVAGRRAELGGIDRDLCDECTLDQLDLDGFSGLGRSHY